METNKKRSIYFWIKQSRHLICFLIVVVFVFCYCFSALAASNTFSDLETFSTRFTLDDNVTYPELTASNILTFASDNGINTANINGGIWNVINGSRPGFDVNSWNTLLKGSINYANTLTSDGITYDLTNSYCILSQATSWNNRLFGWFIWGSGDLAFVNNCIVSNQDFYYFYQVGFYGDGTVTWSGSNGLVHVTQQQANGLYHFEFGSSMNSTDAIYFTDLNMYASSNDGSTGFTNYSSSTTDFSFSAENYNFNFLKTGFGIIGGNDPEPITGDSFIDYAKSKMNFSMTSYYTGGKLLNNAKHDVSIIWPEVVKMNPENFYVVCDYTGRYKDNSLATTISFERQVLHGTTEKWIPVTEIMSRSGGKLPSSFDIDVGLNTLVDGNGKSMYRYFIESVSAFSGASVNSVENNSLWYQFLVDVGEAVSNWLGISDAEQPLAKLAQDIDSYIDVMEIDGYVWIAYSDSSDTYSTGKNHTTFDFKTGDSSTVGTDNTINQYPEEGQDIYNVPSVGGGGTTSNYNQNSPIAYGGQVVLENNIQALVEYLFHIDTDDLLAMQGNISSTFNTVIGQITDTSDNGFLPLLERTYSYIPEEIWTWIKTAVGAVLLIAVWQAFISNKRIKG